jgi:hypothetical protein
MEKAKGAIGRGKHVPRSTETTAARLSDLGISKDQSAKWQQLAAVLEDSPRGRKCLARVLINGEQSMPAPGSNADIRGPVG